MNNIRCQPYTTGSWGPPHLNIPRILEVYSVQRCQLYSFFFFNFLEWKHDFASAVSTCHNFDHKQPLRFWCYHIYHFNDSTENFKGKEFKKNEVFSFLLSAVIFLQNFLNFYYVYNSAGDNSKTQDMI